MNLVTGQYLNTVNMVKLPFEHKPFELFTKLYHSCANAYLLESMEGPEKLAEYSFIGFNPEKLVVSKKGIVTIIEGSTGEEKLVEYSDPLNLLRDLLNERKLNHYKHRLVGGAVGYISYDSVRMWERLPDNTVDDLNFPDLEMGIYQDGVVFNHITNEAHYYYITENRIEEISRLSKVKSQKTPLTSSKPKVNISKDKFEEAVLKAKEYVAAGDIFVQAWPSSSFNLILLKAMSVGTVVAACKGGIDDFIIEDKTAVVFNPDDELSIYNCLRELLNNREKARKIARQAQRYVKQNHSVSKMIDETLQLYNEAVQWYNNT